MQHQDSRRTRAVRRSSYVETQRSGSRTGLRALLGGLLPLGVLVLLGGCSSETSIDDPGGGGGGGVVRGDLVLSANVSSSPPANVSILFEATDSQGNPVANLLTEGTIELFEDGQKVSPFESRQRIQPIARQIAFPTLLLLDLSGSIVGSGNLPRLKESAKRFAETLLDPDSPNATAREIAVAFFPGSSNGRGIQLISGFSADLATIQTRIDAVRGAPDTTTNLNEAVLRAFEALDARKTELLADTEVEITEGSLAVFTDGTDRAGTVSEEEVLSAIGATSNRVFTIGLQGEIDADVLRRMGKSGFVLVDDIQDLQTRFTEVANAIRASANRFYAVEYCSPKRGGEHVLTVVARIGASSGSTSANFDANLFRAGCRVPEGALELDGASDARLLDVTHDPLDGSFLVAGSIRGSANWLGSSRAAAGGSDAFLSRVQPPSGNGSAPTEDWTVIPTGSGDAEATCVATDGAGGTWVAGSFAVDLALGAAAITGVAGAGETAWAASLAETTGNPLWMRAFTGAGTHRIVDCARRADQLVVLGEFTGMVELDGKRATSVGGRDGFVAGMDLDTGACAWLSGFGGAGDESCAALAIDSSGLLSVCGGFSGTMTIAQQTLIPVGGQDVFVATWDAAGQPRWSRAIGGSGSETAAALHHGLDGELVALLDFDQDFDLDGTSIVRSGPARDGLLVRLAPASGAPTGHTVLGDANGGFATHATDLAEDGLGNFFVGYLQSSPATPDEAILGFTMILPDGSRQLDYTYSGDTVEGPVRMTVGPLGLDQAALVGPFRRAGTFGPFPLRFEDEVDPNAPLGGINAFMGFVGPRS